MLRRVPAGRDNVESEQKRKEGQARQGRLTKKGGVGCFLKKGHRQDQKEGGAFFTRESDAVLEEQGVDVSGGLLAGGESCLRRLDGLDFLGLTVTPRMGRRGPPGGRVSLYLSS